VKGYKSHDYSTSIGYFHLELHASNKESRIHSIAKKNLEPKYIVTGNQVIEMAPPKEIASVPKKVQTWAQLVELEVEETLRESSSELRFPQDYIPPRKDDDPLVKLQKTPYYELVMLDIP